MEAIEQVVSDLLTLKAASDRKWGGFASREHAAGKALEEAGELVAALTVTIETCGLPFHKSGEFVDWRMQRIYDEALDIANVALRIAEQLGRRPDGD